MNTPDTGQMLGWDLGTGDETAVLRGEWRGDTYVVTEVMPMRLSNTAYRAQAQRWWARGWNGLKKRERRRLLQRPALLAAHRAWNRERERRFAALTRMLLANVADHPLAPLLYGALLVTEDFLPRATWSEVAP